MAQPVVSGPTHLHDIGRNNFLMNEFVQCKCVPRRENAHLHAVESWDALILAQCPNCNLGTSFLHKFKGIFGNQMFAPAGQPEEEHNRFLQCYLFT